jgi:hypothetical protein
MPQLYAAREEPVDHAAVLDVLCEAGLIAPGPMLELPRLEP